MIYQVRTEDLKAGWEVLRPHILEALPPELAVRETAVSNILKALLTGGAQLWLVYPSDDEDTRIPIAVAVTTAYIDPLSMAKSLLIYSFKALEPLERIDYLESIQAIKKYAKDQNCHNVIAFVSDSTFVEMLEKKADAKRLSTVVRF